MVISDAIQYIGVNDHELDLFEGQYQVPKGMSYNSYLILDEKIAVLDSVDAHFTEEWLERLKEKSDSRRPDYLVVQHMEPDHSAGIAAFMETYPEAEILASAPAFNMIKQFFGTDFADRRKVIKEGDTLSLGTHTLTFLSAPMVHWPEVMVTYESHEKVLFSADAFGKFGALDAEENGSAEGSESTAENRNAEGNKAVDTWIPEARRYYIGIVGKYGMQVQNLLKKAEAFDIRMICPLHGPVLQEHLEKYINLYKTWSSYEAESEGVLIAYASVYGHTKRAAELLAEKLRERGCQEVKTADLARTDMSECVADAFRYRKLVLAAITCNADMFPFMKTYLNQLTEHNFQNRTVAFMENGSWAPTAMKNMKAALENCKNLTYAESEVHIKSDLNEESLAQLEALAEELVK